MASEIPISVRRGTSDLLQPPRALRDTFELLARLQRGSSLQQLADGVDWSGATPQQLSYAVLGRLPENIHYAGLTRDHFDARAYFTALLLSTEFQAGIVPNLLGAFPEKPRRFFVHVPRCGGTSLGETLALHACTIPHNALGARWVSGRGFLDSVADICRGIPSYEAIHVSGHYTLRFVIDGKLARFGDSIWTTVRPASELVLSYMNYILTVIDSDPEFSRPDTRLWSGLLGLRVPLSRLSPAQLRGLLPRMIREDQLLPRDLLCHFLGDGTAPSAVDLLAAGDVEVINSARLDQWREQRWQVPAPPWRNRSRSFFQWSDLHDGERRRIGSLIRQDVALCRIIRAASSDALAVRGLQIARSARQEVLPASGTRSSPRAGRAARPILLDAHFHGMPDGGAGWADPPLHYRTLETTLRFPLLETRIRVRYARRRSRAPITVARRPAWLAALLGRLLGQLGAMIAPGA